MERKLLPTSCYLGMSFMNVETYPTIKFGEYENYIQKFLCKSEEELFEAIEHAVRFGVKKKIVSKKNSWPSLQMGGLLGTVDSFDNKAEDFIAIFPLGKNLEGEVLGGPYYNLYDNGSCLAYISIAPRKFIPETK